MSQTLISYGIATYVSQNILIVPFQSDFYQEVIEELSFELSFKLCNTPDLIGLIIDLSLCKLLDLNNIKSLEAILDIATMLGMQGYLVGLQPTVALVLAELGYSPPEHLCTALNIEQAMELINQTKERSEETATIFAYSPENTYED